MNSIEVPEWVFAEFALPYEKRNFRYVEMLNRNGKYVDLWGNNASVPDITRTETQLWFMFLAGTYMHIGCEALHLGQIALIGIEDSNFEHWGEMLDKIRSYAKKHARRNWVLLDAHTPAGGWSSMVKACWISIHSLCGSKRSLTNHNNLFWKWAI